MGPETTGFKSEIMFGSCPINQLIRIRMEYQKSILEGPLSDLCHAHISECGGSKDTPTKAFIIPRVSDMFSPKGGGQRDVKIYRLENTREITVAVISAVIPYKYTTIWYVPNPYTYTLYIYAS